MATPRAEAPRTEEKPAREAAPEPAAALPRRAEGSAMQAWLPLVAALVLMPLMAYGVTAFILVPRLQKALGAPAAAPAAPANPESHGEAGSEAANAPAPAGQRQRVTLNRVLVNVAGTMGSRYLLTSMTLVGAPADLASRVSQNEPQLRDMASGLLSTKTIADLEKPGARNLLRGELLAGFNNVLGAGAVQEIYFTEFAIQ